MSGTWTDERIAKLKELWAEGLSTAEIGKQLGVSKNAVVGKAHRLKLSARQSPIKKRNTTILDLKPSSCRWPIGHPGENDFHFCGKKAMAGKPYCDEHAAVAYIQPKDRRGEDKSKAAAR